MYGIILAAAVFALHPQPMDQNGVLHIQHLYKVVADRYLELHSSVDQHRMSAPMVFGNQEMVRPAALETATLAKHGH